MNKLLRFLSNLFAKLHIILASKIEQQLGGAGYIQSFNPDICECEIGFTKWDNTWHKPKAGDPWDFVKNCSSHVGADKDTLFAKIKAESQLKNNTEAELQKALPLLTDTAKDGAVSWKPGIEYQWSFDTDRKLSVSVTNVADKTSLQQVLDSKFGKDEVTIL